MGAGFVLPTYTNIEFMLNGKIENKVLIYGHFESHRNFMIF